jgi:hypothetical protein
MMQAEHRAVGVVPLSGVVVAAVVLAAFSFGVARGGTDAELLSGSGFLQGGAPAGVVGVEPSSPPYAEFQAEVGWPLLRPSEEVDASSFAWAPSAETDAALERVRLRYDRVDRPGEGGVIFTQQLLHAVPPDPGPFASEESIGRFHTYVFTDGPTVRARFLTGTFVGQRPVVGVVEAPDRETLARFMTSLSFGERPLLD